MQFLKNLKFVRKIQGGYTILGVLAGLSLAVGYWGLYSIGNVEKAIFTEYVNPKHEINVIFSNFRKAQFIMMKCSMPEFADKFSENMAEYSQSSKVIDASIDSLLKSNFDQDIIDGLNNVKNTWQEYKSLVADAIISASVTQNYDMAADIVTSSGEEVGAKMLNEFEQVLASLDVKLVELNGSIEKTRSQAELITILSMIIGTAIYIFASFYMAPAISKPINGLQELVKEFALGDYSRKIVIKAKDEIGELTNSLIMLQRAQLQKISVAEQIAEGSLVTVEAYSDKDALAHAFNKMVDTISRILDEADKLIAANKRGDLEVKGNIEGFSGSWQKLIEGINSIVHTIVKPLNESERVLNGMAQGDFTMRIDGDYKGYYGKIKNNINTLAESLNKALGEVAEHSQMVMQSANEISSSSEQMAAGAHQQTQQTVEVAGSVDEITKAILENTKNASLAADIAKESGEKAKEGGEVVNGTIEGMMRIANVVQKSAQTVEALGKNSDQIGEIIQVIDDIADQTNLLALNAAIEAARAGEQGRGFAVVADEVRKLAERTTNATKEIADMIQQIQKDTADAVKSMQEGTAEVNSGKEMASKAGSVLKEIIEGASKVSDVAGQVAAASEEQSVSAEQISNNIDSISSITELNASGTQEIAQSSEELLNLTEKLQSLVSRFKIDKSSDSYAVRNNGKIISM